MPTVPATPDNPGRKPLGGEVVLNLVCRCDGHELLDVGRGNPTGPYRVAVDQEPTPPHDIGVSGGRSRISLHAVLRSSEQRGVARVQRDVDRGGDARVLLGCRYRRVKVIEVPGVCALPAVYVRDANLNDSAGREEQAERSANIVGVTGGG